jgi:hypothetical protein
LGDAAAQNRTMLRNIRIAATLCFVALGSLCVFATSSVAAKHSTLTTKQKPRIPTDKTPTSKDDCLAAAHALYGQAKTLSKRTKQIIPREFARVVSKLDEACGERDFEKARISIDWINTCLKNFTKDYKLGFCSRNKSYFCAIDPQSEGCLQSQ